MSNSGVTVQVPSRLEDGYDKVGAEIFRRALENLTNEMALALINTSGSPVVFEVKDFCTSFLDANGEHLSYSAYALIHAGSAYIGVGTVIDQIQETGQEPQPGDAWILNDPCGAGAAHQGDISVITPVFADGELLGWCYTSMHVMDVGGTGVSGYAPGARHIYEEGILIPPTRMVRGGRIDPEWERYISANVRLPGIVLSDIRSMMAANNVGQQKLDEIIEQFGRKSFVEFCEVNKDLTERTFRKRIGAMRDGLYETAEWVEFDRDGEPGYLFEVRARMEIDGEDMRLSFTSEPQYTSFFNAGEGVIYGSVITPILTTLAYGDLPFNQGMWRPLTIDMGETGTIVNAVPPAGMSNGHAETGARVIKCVKELMVQALSLSDDAKVRSRVASQPQEAYPIAGLTGLNQYDEPTIVFLLDNAVGAGGGATSVGDGQDVYFLSAGSGAGLAQIETHESRQPIFFLWRQLRKNSGGPGEHRGGQSLEEAYMVRYTDELAGSVTNACSQVPPRGIGGGLSPATGDFWPIFDANAEELIAAGIQPVSGALEGRTERLPAKTANLGLSRGDVLRLLSGGGAGLGDPLLRDPQVVAKEIADEYITPKHAEAAYGVVLNGADGSVDLGGTEARRHEIRAQRIGGEPAVEQRHSRTVGVAVTLSDDDRAWECGYCASRLAEISKNWRAEVASVERPASEYFGELGIEVRERKGESEIMVTEHACPSCGGLLVADLYPAGFPGFPSPILDGATPPPFKVSSS